ncbi:Fe(3+)-siderophore ABC transporter permease [Chitinimonas arctica]|uniref:Fe(3+)-siderophore ABC transporter permease n=1 Tax=Chitinimonas arctica TaxID=2594795 RepID=A0A516SGB6_9NEIS|nr:Fe(3+)-siderophore ABC transporter permease [Chitinimonas arctica]QDQ27205.1 Fe(3+)-siderophore ABC transporter permease [Chitinimonas arctica]
MPSPSAQSYGSPSSSSVLLRKRLSWLLLCLVLLAAIVLASLLLGAKPIALTVVLDSLFGSGAHPDAIIVRQGRLPRTVLGLLAGAALGISGALIQALTRNPLADPGILGVNAGASFAVIVGISFFAVGSPAGYLGFAFTGALLTTILVYLVGSYGSARLEPMRFVLAGVAISAVMMGLSSGLTLINPWVFDKARFWSAGSLDIRDLGLALQVAPAIVVGCILAVLLGRPLNILGMGEEMAAALGSRPRRVHVVAVLAITLLCGASTAVAGPIGFVGLMIPHIARWMVGTDQRWILPFSLLLAPILLLSSDILGRLLVAGELRVSIVTAFIGAPVLIWLARRGTLAGGGR